MASFLTDIWEFFFGKPLLKKPSPDMRAAQMAPPPPQAAPPPAKVRPTKRRRPRPVGDLEYADFGGDEENISFTLGRSFFVEGRLSPNGRYLVGACDGHEQNGRTKSGVVILVDPRAGREIFRTTMKRANNPHVSDQGLVTVENWKSWGGPLAGALLAFDASGNKLWERSFKANIYTSGMAVDGQTVFISTANSDHEPDSGKTWLLDARTGEPRWVRDGFGEVRFVGSQLMIGLTGDQPSADNQFFPLNEQGLEPPEYEAVLAEHEARANHGKPWWVFPKVQERLGEPDPPLTELDVLLDDVERGPAALTDGDRAKLERWRGEIAERRGDLSGALRCWERALAADPKVGIKRRYDALRRKFANRQA